jgi:hypothetical protein
MMLASSHAEAKLHGDDDFAFLLVGRHVAVSFRNFR